MQDTPSLEELKLKYYELLIRYHSHNNSYIDICRCYKAIYDTDSIAEDPARWKPVSSPAVPCCGANHARVLLMLFV